MNAWLPIVGALIGLVGITLGWSLNQLSQWFAFRRERKKAMAREIYGMLQIRDRIRMLPEAVRTLSQKLNIPVAGSLAAGLFRGTAMNCTALAARFVQVERWGHLDEDSCQGHRWWSGRVINARDCLSRSRWSALVGSPTMSPPMYTNVKLHFWAAEGTSSTTSRLSPLTRRNASACSGLSHTSLGRCPFPSARQREEAPYRAPPRWFPATS